MSYVKLRTYWIDFVGSHNKYPIKSKAQYVIIDSVNGFSDIYEDPHSLIRQGYCLDIDTKEHETKTLWYFDKEEAEDALQQLICAFGTKTIGSLEEPYKEDLKNPY